MNKLKELIEYVNFKLKVTTAYSEKDAECDRMFAFTQGELKILRDVAKILGIEYER